MKATILSKQIITSILADTDTYNVMGVLICNLVCIIIIHNTPIEIKFQCWLKNNCRFNMAKFRKSKCDLSKGSLGVYL